HVRLVRHEQVDLRRVDSCPPERAFRGLTHRPDRRLEYFGARHLVHMQGREVFKNAVRSMAEACDLALQQAGMTSDEIDLLIPHQANVRIIEATAKYAGLPMDKVFVNVDRYGNMSSASIPVGLDEAQEQGLIGPGSKILTVAFGAGLTWGAMVLRW
ncbi:MAG TPA: 3-oxoacyl-[acyl-carrier-protein] synthase III C-terminal domain-containing protein, partial [Candidatus Limnocylindrales bacterium]|nr:3-oxoacyl-[acyl-carrier-protein] synthase III C-terminal domain-containing protein [Candidatus Limnocylindrales bacterium]